MIATFITDLTVKLEILAHRLATMEAELTAGWLDPTETLAGVVLGLLVILGPLSLLVIFCLCPSPSARVGESAGRVSQATNQRNA